MYKTNQRMTTMAIKLCDMFAKEKKIQSRKTSRQFNGQVKPDIVGIACLLEIPKVVLLTWEGMERVREININRILFNLAIGHEVHTKCTSQSSLHACKISLNQMDLTKHFVASTRNRRYQSEGTTFLYFLAVFDASKSQMYP